MHAIIAMAGSIALAAVAFIVVAMLAGAPISPPGL
jgi:hypothetical protein